MAQRILGLDIGATTARAVVVESSYRGFSVLDVRSAPVPPPEGEVPAPLRARQLAAVKALAEGGLPFETAVVALPGAAAAHHVTLPFSDPRRVEQTVAFEVEAQIPFDLADVAWDWQPLQVRDGKSELFVAVVKKEELSGLLAGLAEAAIDPRIVLPAGPAYAALFGSGVLAEDAPDGPVLGDPAHGEALLDVGHTRTSLCLVANGACESARTFPLGAHDLARKLAPLAGGEAAALALISALARGEVPVDAGDAIRVRDALQAALAPLARELRATIKAWRARSGAHAPVRRLLLAGELARVQYLPEILRPEVDGEVAPVAFVGPAAERLDAAQAPGFALALSLALRGHQGARAPRLNLRRGDLAYTRDFQHVRGKVARLGAWAVLVLLLAMVSSGVKAFALSRHERQLNRALCDATQTLVGRCYEDFDTAVSVLKGKGTAAAAIPKNSAVDVFAELTAKTPKELPLKLDRIEITRDKIHLQGTTDAAENVDKIVTALRGSRCFGDARSGGARRRSSDGQFEFTVDSDLTCDTGAARVAAKG